MTTTRPCEPLMLPLRHSCDWHVLHVQSCSHWAPICVGPYSQANTLRSVVHFLVGQIGLEPSVDEAVNDVDGTTGAVVAECGASPRFIGWGFIGASVIGIVYVSESIGLDVVSEVEQLCHEQVDTYSGVVPGAIEAVRGTQSVDLKGYKDEETMLELSQPGSVLESGYLALLAVCIPEMPVGAVVKVEATAATSSIASCVEMASTNLIALRPPASTPLLGWVRYRARV